MHFEITGKGKAVILIHGFIEEGSMWKDVAKVLSKNHRVIVPDLEGFGSSPLQTASLSMEYYAGEIYGLLKQLKVKKCIMLGHSMGGYITLHFAEKHPEMLTAYGLIDSHCFADTEEKKANRKKGNDFIARHGSKPFVAELYNNIFHPVFKKKNQQFIDNLIAKAEKYTPEALIAANSAMMNRADKSEVLKNAQVPVLLINGKQDESAPLDLTSRQASFPPVADVHFYDECKHMSIFEKKADALKRITAFCDR